MGQSQYEKDQARRGRREAAKDGGNDARPRTWFFAAGAIAVVAVIALLLMSGDEASTDAEGFEANFEAFGLADDPFIGNASAPVAVVGFEAPQCSACQFYHNNLLPDLKRDYADTGKAAIYYVQYTIGNDGDFPGGIAQECALEHGGNDAFWSMTDSLYSRSSTYSIPDHRRMLEDTARLHGLDAEPLIACYDDQDTHRAVSRDWNIAEAWGVRGTPTFFVFGPEGRAEEVSMQGLEQVLSEVTA